MLPTPPDSAAIDSKCLLVLMQTYINENVHDDDRNDADDERRCGDADDQQGDEHIVQQRNGTRHVVR